MTRKLRHAAVIGAGVMGSQIAAHLANAGVTVDLLDIVPSSLTAAESAGGLTLGDREVRDRLAREALHRLATMRPSPLFSAQSLERIRPGNLEDDLDRLAQADWIVEAVVEDLAPKRALWARLEPHAPPTALLSTNTSGLSIAAIAEGRGEDFRRRFLGTHFFNPPRYMRLVELIPTPATDPAYLDLARAWTEGDLGKGVVVARDTPNFIANRIGVFATMATLRAMARFRLDPEAVDALTGPVIGHPRSATFRTLDLVGLDTLVFVAQNLQGRLPPEEAALFEVPPYLLEMVRRGWLGQKTGQGFYRRREGEGERVYDVLDLDTLEYRPQRPVHLAALAAAKRAGDLAERLRALAYADDAAGLFTWTVLKDTILYAARHVDEIAGGDMAAVDRAMRWGYNWEIGPFETLAALDLPRAVERMLAEGEDVPAWLGEAAAAGRSQLYDPEAEFAARAVPPLTVLKRSGGLVWRNPEASLVDLGAEVAALEFHPPKDAIGPDLIQALERAADEVERNWRGLVLVNEASANFSVGANLFLVLAAAEGGAWEQVEAAVRALQTANLRLKYLSRPVVAAPWGMALGGGAEICLHAARVQAGAELYIGLVEVGAGVIPAGGGTKEMLLRALAQVPEGAPWTPSDAGSAAGSVGPFFDPVPFLLRAFETIATAKVSTSAVEARALGFLAPTDAITMNRDRLVADAREVVLHLDRLGYRPPDRRPVRVPGREARAVLDVAVDQLRRGRRISEHDARIAHTLAHVLTGGDLPQGALVDEGHILDLEREAFLRLLGEERTRQRIRHLLQTGRPLRN
jgi:3-hydroxyacyl-CoA dehydrogenase